MHSLFLLRHAEAVSTAENDKARVLTAKGREDTTKLARKMVALMEKQGHAVLQYESTVDPISQAR